MDLITLSALTCDALLGATFGYLIKRAVSAGRESLESIGILDGENLYRIWEDSVEKSITEVNEAYPCMNTLEIDIRQLLHDFEEILSEIAFTPLRISTTRYPTWLIAAFHKSVSKQVNCDLERSNKLLSLVMASMEIGLVEYIAKRKKSFRKETRRRLRNIQEEIELITPAMPITSKECEELENMFIPSQKHATLVQRLKEQGFVFITGTPHVGKSFTAKHLLMEHAYKGYEPLLVSPSCEILFLRKLLDSYEKRILLVDDVYGKYRYEASSGNLLENLGELLRILGDDRKLVVTSRYDIFNEARYLGRIGDVPLEDFIVSISPEDYSSGDRKQILKKSMLYRNVDNKTRKLVRRCESFIIKNLMFPHNISWFVEHYLCNGLSTVGELRKAVRSSMLIGREIENFYEKSSKGERMVLGILSARDNLWGSWENILNKAFALLKDGFVQRYTNESTDFFYEPLIMLKRLVDYKIITRWWKNIFEFHHPTYSQFLINAFVSDPSMMWASEILATNLDETTASITHASFQISNNYPSRCGQLLRMILKSSSESVRRAMVFPVFHNLEETVERTEETITKLSRDIHTTVRVKVAQALGSYFKKSLNYFPQIFIALSKDSAPEVRDELFIAILENLDKAPTEIKEVFSYLAKELAAQPRNGSLCNVIVSNISKAPEELIPIISKVFEYDLIEPESIVYILSSFKDFPQSTTREFMKIFEASGSRSKFVIGRSLQFMFDVAPVEFANVISMLMTDPNGGVRQIANEAARLNPLLRRWSGISESASKKRPRKSYYFSKHEKIVGRLLLEVDCPFHGLERKTVIVTREASLSPHEISISFEGKEFGSEAVSSIAVGSDVPKWEIVPLVVARIPPRNHLIRWLEY